MVGFVDSFSRRGQVYGMRTKADLLSYAQKFIADVGKPQCLRMDNAGENTSRRFVVFGDHNSIRRKYTASHTGQKKTPVESLRWRVLKGGHSARLDIRRLFPFLDFSEMEHLGKDFQLLWMEAALLACECTNHSASSANPGMLSPNEAFFGTLPPLKKVSFSPALCVWTACAKAMCAGSGATT